MPTTTALRDENGATVQLRLPPWLYINTLSQQPQLEARQHKIALLAEQTRCRLPLQKERSQRHPWRGAGSSLVLRRPASLALRHSVTSRSHTV
jgi:hypothetical protein